MAAPVRSPRTTRASGGGRALLLIGVLLALAAGGIVIFVVSQYTGGPTQMETVVVAAQTLNAGTKLTTDGSNSSTSIAIAQAFTTKSVNTSFAPSDAYLFTSQDALNTLLNGQTIGQTFYAGEILRQSDPRLTSVAGAPGSLTNVNLPALKTCSDTNGGDPCLITEIKLDSNGSNGKPAIVPGDHVDVLAYQCNLPGAVNNPGHCEAQVTVQNVYVYDVQSNFVFIVTNKQNALSILYLSQTGTLELAIRQPGDTNTNQTTATGPAEIVAQFHF